MQKSIYLFILLLMSNIPMFAQKNQWTKTFRMVNTNDQYSITNYYIDINGDIIICGTFSGTIDMDFTDTEKLYTSTGEYYDSFFARYDKNMILKWSHVLTSEHSVYITHINKGLNGNIYVAGQFDDDTDFDPSINGTAQLASDRWQNNYHEVFLAQFDNDGNFQWVKHLIQNNGVHSNDLHINVDTISGKIYALGLYSAFGSDNLDFDPSSNQTTLSGSGNNFFLAQYDLNANLGWVKKIEQSVYPGVNTDQLNDLKVDSEENVYFTGRILGTYDFDPTAGVANVSASSNQYPAFISKFTKAGTFSWVKLLETNYNSSISSLTFDSNNNLYLAGGYSGTVDFDPGSGVSSGSSPGIGISEGYFACFTKDGNLTWVKTLERSSNATTGSSNIKSINLDLVKNRVHISGLFSNSTDFNPDPSQESMSDLNKSGIFIATYSLNGSFMSFNPIYGGFWQEPYTTNLDKDGSIYIISTVTENTKFNSYAPYNSVGEVGKMYEFLAKFTYFGILGFGETSNGCEGNDKSLMVVPINDSPTYKWYKDGTLLPSETNSNLIISNFSLSDEGTYSCVGTTTSNGKDSIVTFLKFYAVGSCITSTLNSTSSLTQFDIAPVPAEDFINITFNTNNIPGTIKIEDITGSAKIQISNIGLSKQLNIDISILSPGLYFIRTSNSEGNMKFIKQ